jgi:hypothetical protein
MVLTMVYNTQNYWVLGLFPSSGILENTTFRKLELFPSSGEGGGEDTYSVGPLRKELISITGVRTETDPVSETSCSPEYQTMEKVQKEAVGNETELVILTLSTTINREEG